MLPLIWDVIYESCGRLVCRRIVMPRQYPPGFRNELVQQMVIGEPVLSVRDDTGVPEQKLHRWKHQGLIDAGVKRRC
jgi:hypothetical protein